jgi:hypothetical protein
MPMSINTGSSGCRIWIAAASRLAAREWHRPRSRCMKFSEESMGVTVMVCEDMGSATNDVHHGKLVGENSIGPGQGV